MISGHYPFSLIPRLFEDWSELGDGSVYAREGAVRRMPVPPGAATAGPAGYAAAMEYQLEVAADYAVRFLAARRALIVVVGDHQPYSGITGQGKTRSVPIHVWSREPELLEPFLRRGYTPGLVPRQQPAARGPGELLAGVPGGFQPEHCRRAVTARAPGRQVSRRRSAEGPGAAGAAAAPRPG